MKQIDLFGEELSNKIDSVYTSKIKAPIYQPKNVKPHPMQLYDKSKTNRLIQEIENSNCTELEKSFLIAAAQRHTIFNYSKIADYYANSNKEVQKLMEHSALVIIDFEKAIQYGYVKLSEDMANLYLNEYGETTE